MATSAQKLIAKAYQLYKAGELIEARSLVGQAVKLEPENANAWYMVGLLSSDEKTKRKAFEKALKLDPQHKYARTALEMIKLPMEFTDAIPPSAPSVESPSPAPISKAARAVQIAQQVKATPPKPKAKDSVGWVLPSLVVVAIIGLVAVIVVVVQSRPATLVQPTAAALAQPTAGASETVPPSVTPTKTVTATETSAPTEKVISAAVGSPTKPSDTKIPSVTPTVTLTPSATLNMVTVTPSPTRVANVQVTGQILLASQDDVYSVNVSDASVINLTNHSQSQIRSARWSPDRQHILMTANGALVITDAAGSTPRQLDIAEWRAHTAAWSPDGTQIAFVGYNEQRMSDYFLFVVNADGTNLKQITPNTRQFESLDWVTDGITYSLGSQNSVGLWLISPTGGEPTMLVSSGGALGVSWSPDHQRLLFRSTPPNMLNTELFVSEAGNIRNFPTILGSVMAAAWSPDGTQIAYAMIDDSGAGYSIFVIAQDGSDKPVRIATRLAYPMSIEWIGDGGAVTAPELVKLPAAEDAILFVRSLSNSVEPDKKHTDLFVLNADGTQRQLTNFMQNVSDPAWSPDGKQIAFTAKGMAPSRDPYRAEEAPSRIYIMNADGSGVHQVTPELPEAERPMFEQIAPRWSPDGLLIAYVHAENAVASLRVIDTQGAVSAGRVIGTFNYIGSSAAWSPDGAKLVLYGGTESSSRALHVVDVASGETHALTDFPGAQPAWSPDGKQIAVVARVQPTIVGAPFTIYVMNASGSSPQRVLTEEFEFIHGVTWSPDGTRIAFSGERDKFTHLYLMNADGSDVQVLTSGDSEDITPRWKPNGTPLVVAAPNVNATPVPATPANVASGILAYSGVRGAGLCLAKPGGADARCVQKDSFFYNLRWSPDGTRLAYVSGSVPNTFIYVAEADGSVKQLTTEQRGNTSPAWSPDGQRIAFISGRMGSDQIFVMNADGSDQHVLTHFNSLNIQLSYASLAWSPDGKTILFSFWLDANTGDVYRMDVDGSNVRRLNKQGGGSVVFSPDGTRVAFVSVDGDRSSIMLMNADGSNVQALTYSLGYNADPAWSPDGRFIVFKTTRDNPNSSLTSNLYVMGADGTDPHKIGDLVGSNPAWSPIDTFALPK